MGFISSKKDLFFTTTVPGTLGTSVFYANKDKFFPEYQVNVEAKDESSQVTKNISTEYMDAISTTKSSKDWNRVSGMTDAFLKKPVSFSYKTLDKTNKTITFKWFLKPIGKYWNPEGDMISDGDKHYRIIKWVENKPNSSKKCRYQIISDDELGLTNSNTSTKDEFMRKIVEESAECTGENGIDKSD